MPLCLILLTAAAVGCGDAGDFLAISGSITYDGQPVTNGSIGFVQQNVTPAKRIGTTIADGRYEFLGHEGLVAGSYQVMIFSERPSGRKIPADEGSSEMIDQMVQYIPDVYNSRTTLLVEVLQDREDLDFALEKPKSNQRRRR